MRAVVGQSPAEPFAAPRAEAGVACGLVDVGFARLERVQSRAAARQGGGDFVPAASLTASGFTNATVSEAVWRSDDTIRGSGGITIESRRRNDRRASATSSPRSDPDTRQPLVEWPSVGRRQG